MYRPNYDILCLTYGALPLTPENNAEVLSSLSINTRVSGDFSCRVPGCISRVSLLLLINLSVCFCDGPKIHKVLLRQSGPCSCSIRGYYCISSACLEAVCHLAFELFFFSCSGALSVFFGATYKTLFVTAALCDFHSFPAVACLPSASECCLHWRRPLPDRILIPATVSCCPPTLNATDGVFCLDSLAKLSAQDNMSW